MLPLSTLTTVSEWCAVDTCIGRVRWRQMNRPAPLPTCPPTVRTDAQLEWQWPKHHPHVLRLNASLVNPVKWFHRYVTAARGSPCAIALGQTNVYSTR